MRISGGKSGAKRVHEPTHYETIGVRPKATIKEIDRRIRELGRQLHPDLLLHNPVYAKRHTKCAFGKGSEGCIVCGSAERWKRVTYAHSILKDDARRRQYDAELALRGAEDTCPMCKGEGTVFSTGRGFAKINKTCPTCNGSGRKERDGEQHRSIKL